MIRSGQIWPGHPEKVLACRREFAALQPDVAVALTTVVLEACRWLDADAEHRREAAAWLAEPDVIGLPVRDIESCLLLAEAGGGDDDTRLRFQFRRWGWLPPATDDADATLIGNVHRIETYREAARRLGVAVPESDTRDIVLFDHVL